MNGFLVKPAHFEVVYNAIDLDRFRFNAEARAQARADLGLVGNQFAIGHVGRFTAQKNHAFLIDVFTEVAKRRDDAVLLLVGTGEAGASVKALVDERGLTDRVEFWGREAMSIVCTRRLTRSFCQAFTRPGPRRRRGTGVWPALSAE